MICASGSAAVVASLVVGTKRRRPAPDRTTDVGPTLVVAQARLVVGEEDPPNQISTAAYAGLVEHALQVLLHGVRSHGQRLRDLGGGGAPQHLLGDVTLALGQLVSRHEQRVQAGRMGGFDDQRDPVLTVVDKRCAVHHQPSAAVCSYSGGGEGLLGSGLRGLPSPPIYREDGRRQAVPIGDVG